jgi:hypothetical protein
MSGPADSAPDRGGPKRRKYPRPDKTESAAIVVALVRGGSARHREPGPPWARAVIRGTQDVQVTGYSRSGPRRVERRDGGWEPSLPSCCAASGGLPARTGSSEMGLALPRPGAARDLRAARPRTRRRRCQRRGATAGDVAARTAGAERLEAKLALELHETPDLGAICADVGLDVGGGLANGGQLDAERLRTPVKRGRDRPAEVEGRPVPRFASA